MPGARASWQERFWRFVTPSEPDECWLWTGSRDRAGYGILGINERTSRAHRLSWTMENGDIPYGMHVLHRCDTPSCVNPNHLFVGTNQYNADDMVRKGRQFRGNKSRAKFTPDDVRLIRLTYDTLPVKMPDLAKCWNTSAPNIRSIVTRQTWREVAD